MEKGIIKGKSLSVDTTHILANSTKKVPERVMKHLAKKIFKGLKADIGFVPEEIPVDLPDYKEIEDHQESKETMKTALETVLMPERKPRRRLRKRRKSCQTRSFCCRRASGP